MSIIRRNSLALAIGLAFGPAWASDWCPTPVCIPAEYEKRIPQNLCPSGVLKSCVPHYEPPGVELIDCSYDGWGTHHCTIWPQGNGMSYSFYSSAGQLSQTGPTLSPHVDVSCSMPFSGVTLTVTVTSPFGIGSSAWVSLPCQRQQEY